jgi:hypothetical protein
MGTAVLRIGVVLIAAATGFVVRGYAIVDYPSTLSCLSPDDRMRVQLTEIKTRFRIDRNFQLRLEDMNSLQSRIVFRSPDEGSPIGSERVIWSVDLKCPRPGSCLLAGIFSLPTARDYRPERPHT